MRQNRTIRLRPPRPWLLVPVLIAAIGLAGTALPGPSPAAFGESTVRIALVVVVDQLRPDLLHRLRPSFGAGGFRRIMEGGAWFEAAAADHFPTFTSVGHAALFTGASVSGHGLAANDWADPATGARVYGLEDPAHTILGRAPRLHEGTSPRNLTATTIGDELIEAGRGRPRVFAVSWKDRAAIPSAGRRGKAFWFAPDTGEFVSSTYYYRAYPDWAARWNRSRQPDRLANAIWELSPEMSAPSGGPDDDRPEEKGHKRLGRSFPHRLPAAPGPDLFDAVGTTPFADALTVDFALALLEAEGLGRGPAPDLLAVSLTGCDAIGHAYGPSSLEYQDQILRLDGQLARLFGALDRIAGRDRVLIVLASDHGVDEIPEVRAAQGYDTGRLDGEAMRSRLNSALRKRFGLESDLVDAFYPPGFHIDETAAARAGLKPPLVEEAAAEVLRAEPGVAWALTRTDLLAGRIAQVPELESVRRSVHPSRTPHIVVIQRPFWYFYDDPAKHSAMHGSPYAYDSRVPLGFAGPGIAARRYISPARLVDVAPTLALWLGTAVPSASVGVPLLMPSGGGTASRAGLLQPAGSSR